jgi:phosphopantothenate synthetase
LAVIGEFMDIQQARAAYEAANAAFIAAGRADLSVDANRAAFIAATRAKQAAFAAYVEARKAA